MRDELIKKLDEIVQDSSGWQVGYICVNGLDSDEPRIQLDAYLTASELQQVNDLFQQIVKEKK